MLMKTVAGILRNNTDKLIEESETLNFDLQGIVAVVQDLNSRNENLKQRADDINSDLKKIEEEKNEMNNFNYLCCLGFLYAAFMLIVIGVAPNFEMCYVRNSLFILHILYVIVFSLLFTDKWLKSGYLTVLYTFSTLIFVAYFTGWYFFNHYIDNPMCTYNYDWINCIMCIVLPAFHFVYYFIQTITHTRKSVKAFTSRIDQLKVDCEAFANSMKESFRTANLFVNGMTQKEATNDEGNTSGE